MLSGFNSLLSQQFLERDRERSYSSFYTPKKKKKGKEEGAEEEELVCESPPFWTHY